MKIEIRSNEVEFENVPIGDLFVYPAGSCCERDVYMAVDEHNICGDRVNAVRLSDGYLHEFGEKEEVRVVSNAKLIVE